MNIYFVEKDNTISVRQLGIEEGQEPMVIVPKDTIFCAENINSNGLNASHGEAIFSHRFAEYGPYRGEVGSRRGGAMVAMSTDKAVAYALDTLQQRGSMFVSPGDECYEGMIVGESAKDEDMDVNVSKTKQLGNQRSSNADKAIQLTPPVTFTLEEALEYIADDELVEVTPKSIRLRKRTLGKVERKKERARALGK